MSAPVRMCVGCRRTAPKADLVRLAWSAGAEAVVVDPRQRLPGRGCYLHRDCGEAAVRRKVVGRALRRQVEAGQVAALLGGMQTSAD